MFYDQQKFSMPENLNFNNDTTNYHEIFYPLYDY